MIITKEERNKLFNDLMAAAVDLIDEIRPHNEEVDHEQIEFYLQDNLFTEWYTRNKINELAGDEPFTCIQVSNLYDYISKMAYIAEKAIIDVDKKYFDTDEILKEITVYNMLDDAIEIIINELDC